MSPFTLFPSLPRELQDQVWTSSITYTPVLLPRPPINGLSACRASRTNYLRTYSLSFKPLTHILFPRPITLYANLDLDILYLDDCTLLERKFADWIEPVSQDRIQHLAVEDRMWRCEQPRTKAQEVDLRYQIWGPEHPALRVLKVLSLVLTSEAYGAGLLGQGEVDDEAVENVGENRRLVVCGETFPEDEEAVGQVRGVFGTLDSLHLTGLYEGWVEPEVRVARIAGV